MMLETVADVASDSSEAYSPSEPSFHALRDAWRVAARARLTTAAQHAAYTLWRGHSLEAAFTPITHPQKIVSCGNDPHHARRLALLAISQGRVEAFAPWAAWLADCPVERGRYTQLPEWAQAIQQAARAAL